MICKHKYSLLGRNIWCNQVLNILTYRYFYEKEERIKTVSTENIITLLHKKIFISE